jgi:prepilin-type N-terminal cleavage/methylation domain-containing protein
MKPLHRTAPRAFTLIELLVVMAILSILGAMVIGGVMAARANARKNQVIGEMKMLEAAIARYQNDFSDFPPSEGDDTGLLGNESLLKCLLTDKKEGPYIAAKDFRTGDTNRNGDLEILDVWNKPLRYIHHRDYGKKPPNKREFRLGSGGPNGTWEDGGKDSDDLVNWDKAKPDLQ